MNSTPETALQVAQIIQLAVAPVFLLAGIGAFLNVCAARLARIVDRSREVTPRLLASRGGEHDGYARDLRILDRRMHLVSWAISVTVLSAVLVCAVVVLLFAASLANLHVATAIALLFIGSMVSLAAGFFIFLVETRVAARALRIDPDILGHQPEG
jgi:hypothetical protein